MKRREQTEILVNCDEVFLKQLSDEVESCHDVRMIDEPGLSLTMVKVRESAQNSLFYLCEVLVSECRVQINNKIGIGIIIGSEFRKAYYLSLIDAAYSVKSPLIEKWEPIIKEEKEKQRIQRIKANSSIMKTKIDFETMDVEI